MRTAAGLIIFALLTSMCVQQPVSPEIPKQPEQPKEPEQPVQPIVQPETNVSTADKPDLQVKEFNIPSNMTKYGSYKIGVSIFNAGKDSTNYAVALSHNAIITSWTNIQLNSVQSHKSGETVTLEFEYVPIYSGKYSLKVVADSSYIIAETNETDNTVIQKVDVALK